MWLAAALEVSAAALPVETELMWLSGPDARSPVPWEFQIDRGRGSGGWRKIPVPSQWELQGFGEYAYGLDDPNRDLHAEIGLYRRRFEVPESWAGRRVALVFEGVMTDATVAVNGRRAGPAHRGGFTRFAYDVTDLLEHGRENLLEVEVREASSDNTVNRAERAADYWLFGGIYRQVYLEARPARSIAHVAVDARHDGMVAVALELSGLEGGETVAARVRDPVSGEPVGPDLSGVVDSGRRTARLEGRVPGVRTWSAEHPNLYRLEVELAESGRLLHSTGVSFGFRTIEIRPGEGLFVNGHRVLLKGLNRHSFWPDSGRALGADQNRRDVEILKGLNANAVRTSHYPPDPEFLAACDELGVYVIDELPGWHDAYRAGTGSRLIAEMVRRDVNHPSVILWANGNEGGWNSLLDNEFARHDPQARPVLHPGSTRSRIDARHYPSYEELRGRLEDDSLIRKLARLGGPPHLVLPTEMLHGLYDGGGGAGLEAYWQLIEASPRAVGGFLWSLVDESVVRTDLGGVLDTRGAYAPDGILGPYREPEASAETVRRLWAPVRLLRADWHAARVDLQNGYADTRLAELRFRWEALTLPAPEPGATERVVFELEVPGPELEPGASGKLALSARPDVLHDALRLTALDAAGRVVSTWAGWAVDPDVLVERWLGGPGARPALEPAPQTTTPRWLDGPTSIAAETGGVDSPDLEVVWATAAQGWVRLEVRHSDPTGFHLRLPGFEAESIEWLGNGPWPVWSNRLVGPTLGTWRRDLDDPTAVWRGARGFYDGVRWMRLTGHEASVTVVVETGDLFVGVSTPGVPADALKARADLPPLGDLSFLRRIPAIGTKFHEPALLGPSSSEGPAAPRVDVVWLRIDPSTS